MAPVIKRIIIFLFSLLIIVLLLAGAAKGEDTLRFDLLNSKEIIKQELPLDSRSSRMIVNQVEEYPKRTFIFDPIVIFDEYDEVMICGQELTMIDCLNLKQKKFLLNKKYFTIHHMDILVSRAQLWGTSTTFKMGTKWERKSGVFLECMV